MDNFKIPENELEGYLAAYYDNLEPDEHWEWHTKEYTAQEWLKMYPKKSLPQKT